jgi:hypothetical protein
LDAPLYRDVRIVMARSDLVGTLFKMGFEEISEPPRFDLVNRLEKRVFKAAMALVAGRERSSVRPEDYRMAFLTRERFAGDEFRAALDHQIDRVAANLARLRHREECAAPNASSASAESSA